MFRLIPRILPLYLERLDGMIEAETRTLPYHGPPRVDHWRFLPHRPRGHRERVRLLQTSVVKVLPLERRPKKFLDHVRNAVRLKSYSIRTEESSLTCTKRSTLFYNMRHPYEMASAEIEAFLAHLAVAQQVAVSTYDQALSALRRHAQHATQPL
jgi:hypothetical protein